MGMWFEIEIAGDRRRRRDDDVAELLITSHRTEQGPASLQQSSPLLNTNIASFAVVMENFRLPTALYEQGRCVATVVAQRVSRCPSWPAE